jgi:hypothetical protein
MHPAPAPPGFGGKDVVPEARASCVYTCASAQQPAYAPACLGRLISKLVMQWLSPLLNVGFTRPLKKDGPFLLPTASALLRSCSHRSRSLAAPRREAHARALGARRGQLLRARPARRAPRAPARLRHRRSRRRPGRGRPGRGRGRQGPGARCGDRRHRIGRRTRSPRAHARPVAAARAARLFLSPHLGVRAGQARVGHAEHDDAAREPAAPGVARGGVRLPSPARGGQGAVACGFVCGSCRSGSNIKQGKPPRGVGYGVGIAFAIFAMQECASLVCPRRDSHPSSS